MNRRLPINRDLARQSPANWQHCSMCGNYTDPRLSCPAGLGNDCDLCARQWEILDRLESRWHGTYCIPSAEQREREHRRATERERLIAENPGAKVLR